jgi:hypothetical protein
MEPIRAEAADSLLFEDVARGVLGRTSIGAWSVSVPTPVARLLDLSSSPVMRRTAR